PMNVSAGRHDAGPFLEEGNDPGNTGGRHGRHGDDREAAVRQGGAVDEIHLPAYTGVLIGAHRIGADLAGQIDLDRAVDGHHFRVLADHGGIVHIADIHHAYFRVVVYEVEKPAGAVDEGGHRPAGIDFLAAIVDHSALDKRDHAIREHFRMQPQVFVARQVLEHLIRNMPD